MIQKCPNHETITQSTLSLRRSDVTDTGILSMEIDGSLLSGPTCPTKGKRNLS